MLCSNFAGNRPKSATIFDMHKVKLTRIDVDKPNIGVPVALGGPSRGVWPRIGNLFVKSSVKRGVVKMGQLLTS